MHRSVLLIFAVLMVSQAAVISNAPLTLNPIVLNPPTILTDTANKVIENSANLNQAVDNLADNFFNDNLFRPRPTIDADIYFGSAEITVTNGDVKKIEFYGTFIPQPECSYSRCFWGWIDNYTIVGEASFLGVNGNDTVKPYFEFKTNSEEDFVINRDPNLKEVWVQII